MIWCEQNRVDFVFGLARNTRLVEPRSRPRWPEARTKAEATGRPARVFQDFRWSTSDSGRRRRRVIAKAEWTRDEANPRFLVTSLKPDRWARGRSMRTSTVPGARWRTASRRRRATSLVGRHVKLDP